MIKIVKRSWGTQDGTVIVRYAVWKDSLPFREYSQEEYEAFKKGMGIWMK